MSSIEIWHNPRCSKSRQALALLQEQGYEPTIIKYLESPPTPQQLTNTLSLLGISARQVIRTAESIYKELGLADTALSEQQLIETLCANPKLIERPIVINGNKAIIGRPPEKTLEIL